MTGTSAGRWLALLLGPLAMGAGAETGTPPGVQTGETEAAVVKTFARFHAAAWEDAVVAAEAMRREILAFCEHPEEPRLERARVAWRNARGPYLMTEVGRFWGGPIDDKRNLENQINPWPIDELYIDAPAGGPVIGVVQDTEKYPELTPEVIARLNARDGEQNISCGWHAIEFLLWGTDLSDDGPGRRPATDFSSAAGAARRRAFLSAATHLLVDDLRTVAAEWRPESSNYRARFESAPASESLAGIITALFQLSGFEMASERLSIGLFTKAQEDEPDCFSDTTSRDFQWGARALASIWKGEWIRVDGRKLTGTGLRAFVAERNHAMAVTLDTLFARSVRLAENLPSPFDRIIKQPDGAPEREAAQRLVEALEEQADLLAHFARSEGIEIEFEHSEEPIQPRRNGN